MLARPDPQHGVENPTQVHKTKTQPEPAIFRLKDIPRSDDSTQYFYIRTTVLYYSILWLGTSQARIEKSRAEQKLKFPAYNPVYAKPTSPT